MQPKNIYILTDTARNSGRGLLQGCLRFSLSRYDWKLHVLEANGVGIDSLIDAVREGIPDGIITSVLENEALQSVLETSNIPLVVIGTRQQALPRRKERMATVTFDEQLLGRTAAQALFQLGTFNAFGYVPHRPLFLRHVSALRSEGFRSGLARHAIVPHEYQPTDETDDLVDLAGWLSALPKPAALFVGNDTRALDVYRACETAGLTIPKDIRLLGVDNDELTCLSVKPTLSSVATDFAAEAFFAAEALERIMKSRVKNTPRRELLFRHLGEIVTRGSTSVLTPGLELVRRAKAYIRLHAGRAVSVDEVVSFLHVSKRTAYLRFQEYAQKSIHETILEERLNVVKDRLRTSRQSIGAITRSCGFTSPNRLKAIFKSQTGFSMRDWRKKSFGL